MSTKAKKSRRTNTARREFPIPPAATRNADLHEMLRFWTSIEWTASETEGLEQLGGEYAVGFAIRDSDDPFIWGYYLGIVFHDVAEVFMKRLFPDRGLNLPELKADVWEEMVRGFEVGTKGSSGAGTLHFTPTVAAGSAA